MSFPGKAAVPFRQRALLAMLAVSGAGVYLSYAVFAAGLAGFSREEAGRALIGRLRTLAAVIDADVKSALAQAGAAAGRPAVRQIAAGSPGDAGEAGRRLAAALAASDGISRAELAGADGRALAAARGRGGRRLLEGAELRAALRGPRVGPPRAEKGRIFYEVSVPVPGPEGGAGAAGVLLARFTLTDTNRRPLAPQAPGEPAQDLALAKRDSQRLVLYAGGGPAAEAGPRSPDGSRFLAALSGRPGDPAEAGEKNGRAVYGWVPVPGAGWVLAGAAPLPAAAGGEAGRLRERARLGALLTFLLLAVSSFFAAGWLAAPLREAGRQAAELLEQCGNPPETPEALYDPKALAAAIEEAASTIKNQSSRDLELENEAEKLREEEADLKSQNDELEKLNKYLMEREIKISELKKEISDLREKVGAGPQERE